jgi:pyrroloquinoline quinone biosynthesis protein D
MNRPRLAAGARLHYDAVRSEHVLLVPEGVVRLNPSAVAVLELCNGERDLDEIVSDLNKRYEGADVDADVRGMVAAMTDKGVVVDATG